jgi:arginine/lysine/ornithine decarboxylase
MTTPIHDFLKSYSEFGFERCHMPGHKGIRHSDLNAQLPFDITEISGAIAIIEESERNAAELFGAGRTLFSCSGSTLAIFAMCSFCADKRVTAFRGAHRSLTDAAILLGFDIDWVYDIDSLEKFLTSKTKQAMSSSAVFATSIDYYGNTADIAAIAQICKSAGLPLLVDNAHGAYLVFTDSHPIRLGAAMSADSAHKTLPALTGAAYLHISKDYFTDKCAELALRAKAGLDLFGTSSPSYLILNSLDLCNKYISGIIGEADKTDLPAFTAVANLKEKLAQTGYSLHKSDSLRITLNANAYGYSGRAFTEELRSRGIVCEMYDSEYVILLFSAITKKENTQRVLEAMRNIPKKSAIAGLDSLSKSIMPKIKQIISPREAYFSPKRTVSVHEAVGRVCAGVHVTIPPCAPPVIPGEAVSDEIALLLERSGIHEIDVVTGS